MDTSAPEEPGLLPKEGGCRPLLEGRLVELLRTGRSSAVSVTDAEEFFVAIDPTSRGVLPAGQIRDTVARVCPHAADYAVRRALIVADPSPEGQGFVGAEAFAQALRLGTEAEALKRAAALQFHSSAAVPVSAAPGVGTVGSSLTVRGKSTRQQLVDALRRRRRDYRNAWVSVAFCCWLSLLLAGLSVGHLRHQDVYRLTEAISQTVPLQDFKTNYPSSLFTWLRSRAELSSIAKYSSVIDGIRISRGRAARPSCYSVAHFVADQFLGKGREQPATPCGKSEEEVLYMHSALNSQAVDDVVAQVEAWWTPSNAGIAVPVAGPDEVQVRILAHNARIGLFVSFHIDFQLPAAGAVQVTEVADAFDDQPPWLDFSQDLQGDFHRVLLCVTDVAFALTVALGLVVDVLFIARSSCPRRKDADGHVCPSGMWGIDALILLLLAVLLVFGLYCVHLLRGLSDMYRALPSVSGSQRYSASDFEHLVTSTWGSTQFAYETQVEALFDQAALLEEGFFTIRCLVAASCAILAPRMLVACGAAHAGVGLLVRTMGRISADLVQFLMLTALTFLSFAAVGHLVFGWFVDDFSTFGGSVNSTFLMMLGFVFEQYRVDIFEQAGVLGSLWVVLLNLLAIIVLLGGVLSIVFGALAKAKADNPAAPSLLQQARHWLDDRAALRFLISAGPLAEEVILEDLLQKARGCGGEPVAAAIASAAAMAAQPLPPGGDVIEESQRLLCLGGGSSLGSGPAVTGSACSDAMLLEGSARLCCRIDANVQELAAMVRQLTARAEAAEAEVVRLKAVARQAQDAEEQARQTEGPQQERLTASQGVGGTAVGDAASAHAFKGSSDMEPQPETGGQDRLSLAADEAEPEPLCAEGSGPDGSTIRSTYLEDFVEERLAEAAIAQESRHARLEEAILRLSQRLDSLFEHGAAEAVLDPTMVSKLEAKILMLTKRLTPILEINLDTMAEMSLPSRPSARAF